MKKILTAVVAALTLTTGAMAQPTQQQKLPEFLQGEKVVQMSEGEMQNTRGEFVCGGGCIIWAGIVLIAGGVGIWYTMSGDVIDERTSGLIPVP